MKDQGEAEIAELEKLLAIVREHDLDAMLVEDGDFRIELVRRDVGPVLQPGAYYGDAPPSGQITPTSAAPVPAAIELPAGETITAPIVGVFYRAPAPAAPAFIHVGDRVRVGQTLCILEAMKLMNEITSETSGVITKINVENGELVTIGQVLFEIEP